MNITNHQHTKLNNTNTHEPKKECCNDCKNGKKGKCHEKIMQQLEKIEWVDLVNKTDKEN